MNRLRIVFLAAACAAAGLGQATPAESNDRGLAAAGRGEHSEAMLLYRQALDGWKNKGPDFLAHEAITLLNLAQTYCAQGNRREGAKLYEEALAKFRRVFGERNEWTLTTMNLLGAAYLMLGEAPRAQALFEEALPIEREVLPGNVQLSRTLQGLATLNLNAGQLDTAVSQAEEALRIATRSDENSTDSAMAYATAAEAHRIAKRYERALPLYRKSRAIYERALGTEHPRIASLLSQEGLILMTEGRYGLAEQQMVRSIEIVKKVCPGCTYELWVGECNLGLLRFKQKRYAEADELLSHSLEIQEKYTPNPGPDMIGTLQALAATREKLRRFDDAARLQKRASTIKSFN